MKLISYDSSGNECHIRVGNFIFDGGVGFSGTAYTSDYTLQNGDFYVGANASSNNIALTVPDATSVHAHATHWFVKRIDNSPNNVIVRLE
ncbi:MAG: hypothetical protein ACTSRA_12290, partial [Promethearchaeota archaeon]